MTTRAALDEGLAKAVALRESGEDERARDLLEQLYAHAPEDGRVNLQCAWIHDKLGLEQEAVPFYERAISAGLEVSDLEAALLGLGSTYRALGRYDEALETLDHAVEEFPEERSLRVFRAMALYNVGRAKEACEILLRLLVDTTSDPKIGGYEKALRVYCRDLDRTWA